MRAARWFAAADQRKIPGARGAVEDGHEVEFTSVLPVGLIPQPFAVALRRQRPVPDFGSFTADLEAAVAVCEAVDGLIEGREWGL
jgi:hypothetical protein